MAIEICCPQGVEVCAQEQPRCNPALCGTYGQPCCAGNQCDEGTGCLSLTVTPHPAPPLPSNTIPQAFLGFTSHNWCMHCGQALNLPPSLNNIELDKIVQPCCKNNQCNNGTCYDVEVVATENADFQSAKMENVCLSEQMKTLAEFYSNQGGAVITFTKRPTSIIPGIPNYAIGIGAVAIVGIFALMWI